MATQQVFEALSNYSSERSLLEARITEESFHNGLLNMEVREIVKHKMTNFYCVCFDSLLLLRLG